MTEKELSTQNAAATSSLEDGKKLCSDKFQGPVEVYLSGQENTKSEGYTKPTFSKALKNVLKELVEHTGKTFSHAAAFKGPNETYTCGQENVTVDTYEPVRKETLTGTLKRTAYEAIEYLGYALGKAPARKDGR